MQTLVVILIVLVLGCYAFCTALMASGKKREANYLEKVIYLESFVKDVPVNNQNFEIGVREFNELIYFDVDRKRTQKLFAKFLERFINEWVYYTVRKDDKSIRFMNLHQQIMSA